MKQLFILSFAVVQASTALADNVAETTVQQLINYCRAQDKSPSSAVQMGYCIGVVSGVGKILYVSADLDTPLRSCTKDQVTNSQMIQIFMNWADKNPKHWQEPDFYGVAQALMDAYPCKEN